MTLAEQALWANQVQRECLLEAGGDIDAGLIAAEYILLAQPVRQDNMDSSWINVPDSFLHHTLTEGDQMALSVEDELIDLYYEVRQMARGSCRAAK